MSQTQIIIFLETGHSRSRRTLETSRTDKTVTKILNII